jgi:hypothetical protein
MDAICCGIPVGLFPQFNRYWEKYLIMRDGLIGSQDHRAIVCGNHPSNIEGVSHIQIGTGIAIEIEYIM